MVASVFLGGGLRRKWSPPSAGERVAVGTQVRSATRHQPDLRQGERRNDSACDWGLYCAQYAGLQRSGDRGGASLKTCDSENAGTIPPATTTPIGRNTPAQRRVTRAMRLKPLAKAALKRPHSTARLLPWQYSS